MGSILRLVLPLKSPIDGSDKPLQDLTIPADTNLIHCLRNRCSGDRLRQQVRAIRGFDYIRVAGSEEDSGG